MPEGNRPRLLQFGESLGAQVALDVAAARDRRLRSPRAWIGASTWARRSGRSCGTGGSPTPRPSTPSGILGKVAQADEIPSPARVGAPRPGHPSRRSDQHVLLRRRRAHALVDGSTGDPAASGPPRDVVPSDHDVRHHAGRPQERDELQARRVRAPRPRLPDRAVRRDPAHVPNSPAHPRAGRADRGWPCARGSGSGPARRMVADKFASARASVLGQLQRWGVDPTTVAIDDESTSKLARGDLSGLANGLGTSGAAG